MKKIILSGLMLCLALVTFTSCNDDNDEMTDSRLTYYPVLELQGEDFVLVPIGETYKEEGCKATLKGEDYTSHVAIYGDVDETTPGLYDITYTVTNPDGFSVSTSRTVAVCDPSITTDISGSYTLQEGSFSENKNNGKITPFSGFNVKIVKMAPGIFKVSDFFGGYYDQGRGYGSSYAMGGYFQLLADNSLVQLSNYVPGWGDSADYCKDAAYDAETQTISYRLGYGQVMEFTIILKK